MTLPYQCPGCGTKLGYKGLCWRCRTAAQRRAALAWTPEEVAAKEQEILAQIADVPDDFWYLLCYRDRLIPEIPRAALAARSFWPSALYYHAPADVRDGLIAALADTEDAREANLLMMCLGMQGDDAALAALLDLERNPRPWRKDLHVDPSVYAQCGGWTFDREGRRRTLNFDTCYPLVHAASEKELTRSPVRARSAAHIATAAWRICSSWTDETHGCASSASTAFSRRPAVRTAFRTQSRC